MLSLLRLLRASRLLFTSRCLLQRQRGGWDTVGRCLVTVAQQALDAKSLETDSSKLDVLSRKAVSELLSVNRRLASVSKELSHFRKAAVHCARAHGGYLRMVHAAAAVHPALGAARFLRECTALLEAPSSEQCPICFQHEPNCDCYTVADAVDAFDQLCSALARET